MCEGSDLSQNGVVRLGHNTYTISMSASKFIYKNIRLDDMRQLISFDYTIETESQVFNVTETLKMPASLPDSSTVDRILRALHIALGISYYKTFLPPTIDHAYSMTGVEADFWNSIFKNGLGEFLYKNGLSSNKLAKFYEQTGTITPGAEDNIDWQETALLGIGGGKDSIVAGELLKKLAIPTTGFVLATGENRGQAQAVADKMQIEMLGIERRINPQLLELNKLQGAYNGHVPISLIFALIGCLNAVTSGSKYVIVANESSASIPQVEHDDTLVNHQWSKSLEFEKSFQDFVHSNISESLDYFSLIRPLTSIAVAKLFAQYPNYFEVFTSDNSLFKIDAGERDHPRWSHDSPKSLSSYILLSPWMGDEDVHKTFGYEFLDDISLNSLFLGLLGKTETPILDCVGTPSELRLSLSMLSKNGRFIESALMKTAKSEGLVMENYEEPLRSALSPSEEHAIPTEIYTKLMPIIAEQGLKP